MESKSTQTPLQVELTRLSTKDARLLIPGRGFIVMRETGRVVTVAWRGLFSRFRMYVFSRRGGWWSRREIQSPCRHNCYLLPLMVGGTELVAISCMSCRNIKLVDVDSEQMTTAFQTNQYRPRCMCKGLDRVIYLYTEEKAILELNCSSTPFNITRTLHSGMGGVVNRICYVPSPHDALVLCGKNGQVSALSLDSGIISWMVEGAIDGKTLDDSFGILYLPNHGSVLVSDYDNSRILALHPADGSILQTIQLPEMGLLVDMCLLDDKLILRHHILGCKVSYFSITESTHARSPDVKFHVETRGLPPVGRLFAPNVPLPTPTSC